MRVSQAGIAQLVERNLAKVEVASSSLVSRSSFMHKAPHAGFCYVGRLKWRSACSNLVGQAVTGLVAEWLCSGLQSRVRRFNSDPGLHLHARSVWKRATPGWRNW